MTENEDQKKDLDQANSYMKKAMQEGQTGKRNQSQEMMNNKKL